jgi:hypothetical protein
MDVLERVCEGVGRWFSKIVFFGQLRIIVVIRGQLRKVIIDRFLNFRKILYILHVNLTRRRVVVPGLT